MIGITNSSIQLWLDFAGDTTPAIPPCQEKSKWSDGSHEDWDKSLHADSCTSVCNDSGSVLDPTMPNNLVTCGLWASLTVMPYKTGDQLGDMNIEDQVNALLEPFFLLGLNHNDADYARIARYTVASGLSALYNRIMSDTYTGITSFTSACAEQELFPYSRLDPMAAPNPTHSLQACIDAICSSRTSNPDLGGIGVFISLLLQISIAIIACLTLAGLEFWPSNKEKRERYHSHALATALVEFHKNQCFFISTIEIAARAFGRQTAVLAAMNHRALPRFDLMLLIPLCRNGFVPIIFTLTFISRYGRLSWYIITLSVVTVALSTGSLATKFAEGSVYDRNGQYLLELGDLICGSSSTILQGAINPIKINLSLVSVIYSCCIVCGLWCIAKHISDRQPKGSHLGRALKACKKLPLKITRNRISSKNISALSNGLLLLLWTTCFGYHIYLYRLFYGNNLISQVWTLGQIIAVTVWVPAVVEFGYIEYKVIEEASKDKYPPGLQVVNMLIRPSAGLANLELKTIRERESSMEAGQSS